ncbi:MAG: hypothetical protein PF904_19020 [Kiritimatiellae bacterium]|nr:hypothetical protein [Kiritimatiellia bacterium]
MSLTRVIRVVEQHQLRNHVNDHRKKVSVKVNDRVLDDPEFEKFWNTVNTRTIYNVSYSTDDLVKRAAAALSQCKNIGHYIMTCESLCVNFQAVGY